MLAQRKSRTIILSLVDPDWYLARYRDVADAGWDAASHYLARGCREGRNPHPLFDASWYVNAYPELGLTRGQALIHYIKKGGFEGRRPHPLFDSAWYLKTNSDVQAKGINPLYHFIAFGRREGRSPHPLFDAGWYLAKHPELAASGVDPLSDFVERGAAEGRNPHPLFDCSWYVQAYPELGLTAGQAFIHYLEKGSFEGRNPHPLFDSAWYVNAYPELGLTLGQAFNHYLEKGGLEGRKPHPLFDSAWYLKTNSDVQANGINPLYHYVACGRYEGRNPNPLLDIDWYEARYSASNKDHRLATGRDVDQLEHYITIGAVSGFKPSPYFDAEWYCSRYPESATSPQTALADFLTSGAAADRNPNQWFDSSWYAAEYLGDAHADIAILDYLSRGRFARHRPNCLFDIDWYRSRYRDLGGDDSNLFRHYIAHGVNEGRFPAPVIEFLNDSYGREVAARIEKYFLEYRLLPEGGATRWSPSQQQIDGWVAALNERSRKSGAENPHVSVVIPVFNQLAHTLACIHALVEHESKWSFEIIIGDDGSDEKTASTIQRLSFIRHVRNETNRGFIANCNTAAAEARGQYVAFLNNDTIVLPGWLDELVDTLDGDDTVGLVGSKLIFGTGLLQEAGGIIWRDGSAWNYGRGQDPRRPEFNYRRDVDYVSGASIILPFKLWQELGGFDAEYYEVAYAEDSDLAFRVRQRGKRVVLQPLSAVLHFEGISSGTDVRFGVKAHQIENGRRLFDRWKSVLAKHRSPGMEVVRERERSVSKRVLFIDAITPRPDEDAGSVTCFRLMRAFQAIGFKVNFIAWSNFSYHAKYTPDLQRLGIETAYAPYWSSREDYIREYGALFDLIFIFRKQFGFPAIELLYQKAPSAKIIFHVSDLHFVREEREAKLDGGHPEKLRLARLTKAQEIYCIRGSDLTVVHSSYEKQLLAQHGFDSKVYVFPWILDPQSVTNSFESREGIGFLGGYNHQPNVDAVLYFVDRIWPKIHETRPDMTFWVFGSHAPEQLFALDGKNNVRVVGYIDDLADCFQKIRIFVAPLRYGAGLKGKIAMAMSYGVPVVTTSCGAEGMDLEENETVLVRDDEGDFADTLLRLYNDKALWNRLSKSSASFIAKNYSTEKGLARVREIVELASGTESFWDKEETP